MLQTRFNNELQCCGLVLWGLSWVANETKFLVLHCGVGYSSSTVVPFCVFSWGDANFDYWQSKYWQYWSKLTHCTNSNSLTFYQNWPIPIYFRYIVLYISTWRTNTVRVDRDTSCLYGTHCSLHRLLIKIWAQIFLSTNASGWLSYSEKTMASSAYDSCGTGYQFVSIPSFCVFFHSRYHTVSRMGSLLTQRDKSILVF